MIQFINKFSNEETFTYNQRIALLRQRKTEQTEEKAKNGGADEDDYGLIEQDEYKFKLEPNHENGSIYGYKAWTDNYCRLLCCNYVRTTKTEKSCPYTLKIPMNFNRNIPCTGNTSAN